MDWIWLNYKQFEKIAPHLPADTQSKLWVGDRRVISGIIHVLKSGGRRLVAARGRWAEEAPPQSFRALGGQERLGRAVRDAGERPRPTYVIIDSSAVKAHRCARGGKGGSRPKRSAARAAGTRRRLLLA